MSGKLCDICKKAPASVHFKQVSDGEVKEVHLCAECAKQNGFSVTSPVSVTDFLLGVGMEEVRAPAPPGKDTACPSCHMRVSDLRKTSRLGCADCYRAFTDELAPLISGMQGDVRHVGKVPAREKTAAEIAAFAAELEKAVEAQKFEEAAELRDLIRDLKARQQAPAETTKGA